MELLSATSVILRNSTWGMGRYVLSALCHTRHWLSTGRTLFPTANLEFQTDWLTLLGQGTRWPLSKESSTEVWISNIIGTRAGGHHILPVLAAQPRPRWPRFFCTTSSVKRIVALEGTGSNVEPHACWEFSDVHSILRCPTLGVVLDGVKDIRDVKPEGQQIVA